MDARDVGVVDQVQLCGAGRAVEPAPGEGFSLHDALTLGLTIGSPLFAVMFGVLLNQRALDKLEDRIHARFSRIDVRMDRLELRMDRLEGRIVDSMKDDQSRFFGTLA